MVIHLGAGDVAEQFGYFPPQDVEVHAAVPEREPAAGGVTDALRSPGRVPILAVGGDHRGDRGGAGSSQRRQLGPLPQHRLGQGVPKAGPAASACTTSSPS